MSLKTVFDGVKYEFSQHKQNKQKVSREFLFEEKLREIRFSDISASFPEKYFLIDFEPLYSFYRIIKGRNIAQLSSSCSRDSYLSELLDNLFVEKEIGMKQLYFSDFSGLVNSKESGYFSFENFKNQQYERNNSDSYINKQIPCFLNRTTPSEIVGIIFKNKKENQRIIDFFMQSKNCMFINSLLEK